MGAQRARREHTMTLNRGTCIPTKNLDFFAQIRVLVFAKSFFFHLRFF